jgi:hypothetical protein
MSKFLRYWNTVRYLEPEQVRHQLGRRLRAALPAAPPAVAPDELRTSPGWGWSVARCHADPDPGTLDGRFRFWGREHRLELGSEWLGPGEGKSWNYMIHYFDHAASLAAAARTQADTALRDRVCAHLAQWIEVHPPGAGLAWEPYPTALRIVNWLDLLQRFDTWCDAAWREQVLRSLYVQAAWLERHLERHLLGTHLLKDAKALVLSGSVFEDARAARWRQTGMGLVREELTRHVRADGGLVEPSVFYHGVAFEDVLDLVHFAVPGAPAGWRPQLLAVARRMLDYLQALRPPGGGYPLVGDAGVDAIPNAGRLVEYAARLGLEVPVPTTGLRWFPDSQMLVWRRAGEYLLADAGGIGPPHLSGHGHCDSLSFEWHLDGLPFVVDSGTQSYEPGAARFASRCTQAHNTLQIDAREQHEIWAAWRVARRSVVHARLENEAVLLAELVPWFDRKVRVRRRFEFGASAVHCSDRVEGPGLHAVTSRLHLHPECEARLLNNVVELRRGFVRAEIRVQTPARVTLVPASQSGSFYCASLGVPVPNAELQIASVGPLPWECSFELRRVE